MASVSTTLGYAVPDYYFSLCNAIVGSNAAVSKVCPEASPECVCGLDWWLETMRDCITTASNASRTPESAAKWSWEAMCATCDKVENGSLRSLQELPQRGKINQTFMEANETAYAGAFHVPLEMIQDANVIEAGMANHETSYVSYYYSMGTLGYFFGIVVLRSCTYWLSWLLPSLSQRVFNTHIARFLRKHIALPALFNHRAAEPFRVTRWLLPRRLISLALFGYYVIILTFLSIKYYVELSPFGYSTQTSFVTTALSTRAAYLATYLLPIVFATAGRNNVLIYLTGWSFEEWNHFHRYLARLVVLLIIVHAICHCITAEVSGSNLSAPWSTMSVWAPGAMALIFMGVMVVQAMKYFREKAYEIFLVVHILMAVGFVASVWYHVTRIGACKEQIYTVVALWAFDRVARIVRILISGPFSRCDIVTHDGVVELTIRYSGLWRARPGQHVFIHFMDPLYFWQAHPFTVMKPEKEDGKILKVFAQAQSGITKHILLHHRREWSVWVDGPYGIEFDTRPFKEIVLIAGGIGITACQAYASHILNQGKDQHLTLHWIIRDEYPLLWFQEQLQQFCIDHPNVSVTTYVTFGAQREIRSTVVAGSKKEDEISTKYDIRSNIAINEIYGRPSLGNITDKHIAQSQGPLAFFVCGPARMSDDVRQAVVTGLDRTDNYVQFYDETFTM